MRPLRFLTFCAGVIQISPGLGFLFWHLWLLVAVEKAYCCILCERRNAVLMVTLLSPTPILILRFPIRQKNCFLFWWNCAINCNNRKMSGKSILFSLVL